MARTPSEHTKDSASAPAGTPNKIFRKNLAKTNLEILEWLACSGREYGIAYQLGRSLRDTANPPLRPVAITNNIASRKLGPADIDGLSAAEARKKEMEDRATKIQKANERSVAKQRKMSLTVDKIELSTAANAKAQREFEIRSAVINQLSRPRVFKLQEWLSTLAPRLPPDSAAIVSASIGRWCDLTTTIFDPKSPGSPRRFGPSYSSKGEIAVKLRDSLLPQGDAWLNLLVGAESSDGLLTPEGFVAAGEAALGRTARIIRKIVLHYWAALLILAVVLAGLRMSPLRISAVQPRCGRRSPPLPAL